MKSTRKNEGINHWNAPEKNKQLENIFRYEKKSTAIISECGKYRYQLERVWDNAKPKILFIMLNPSTAEAVNNDPTIRRCMSFAQTWGYGGLMVGNLFAYRSTNPKELLVIDNPIGEKNNSHLKWMACQCEIIVCAWGNSHIIKKLDVQEQLKQLKSFKLHFLELSIDDTPKHPLYLNKFLKPIPFIL